MRDRSATIQSQTHTATLTKLPKPNHLKLKEKKIAAKETARAKPLPKSPFLSPPPTPPPKDPQWLKAVENNTDETDISDNTEAHLEQHIAHPQPLPASPSLSAASSPPLSFFTSPKPDHTPLGVAPALIVRSGSSRNRYYRGAFPTARQRRAAGRRRRGLKSFDGTRRNGQVFGSMDPRIGIEIPLQCWEEDPARPLNAEGAGGNEDSYPRRTVEERRTGLDITHLQENTAALNIALKGAARGSIKGTESIRPPKCRFQKWRCKVNKLSSKFVLFQKVEEDPSCNGYRILE